MQYNSSRISKIVGNNYNNVKLFVLHDMAIFNEQLRWIYFNLKKVVIVCKNFTEIQSNVEIFY